MRWVVTFGSSITFQRRMSFSPVSATNSGGLIMVYQLEPASAAANLAQGYLAYYGESNYDAATLWFEKAQTQAPNDSDINGALAYISRRKGRWQESASYFQRAVELSPRDASLLESQAEVLISLREYPRALKACNTLLNMAPDSQSALELKISVYQAVGDLATAASLLPPNSNDHYWIVGTRTEQWIYERHYGDAIALVTDALSKMNNTEP